MTQRTKRPHSRLSRCLDNWPGRYAEWTRQVTFLFGQPVSLGSFVLDPFTLVPFALAARGGSADGHRVSDLVAAGHALLQRSVPLVRALQGRTLGILLPPCHRVISALAASEGRPAVLFDTALAPAELERAVMAHGVGACLTLAPLATHLPPSQLRVLLDEAPRRAVVAGPEGERTLELTTHTGLHLEGDPEVPGALTEMVRCHGAAGQGEALSHRTLLETARGLARSLDLTAGDRFASVAPVSSRFGLIHGVMTPLVAGLAVDYPDASDLAGLGVRLMRGGHTVLVAPPEVCEGLVASGTLHPGSALRAAVCGPTPPGEWLRRAWAGATGIPLWQGN